MSAQAIKSFWPFALYRTRKRTGAIVLLVILLVLLGRFVDWVSTLWVPVEPYVSLLTLGIALFVWYEQTREEWEEDHLPKKLTVEFFYDGKPVMRCEKAQLAGEADIRALAQQIGLQMNDLQNLQFVAPAIRIAPADVNRSEKYVHYSVAVHLTNPPAAIKTGTLRIWKEPFFEGVTPKFEDQQLNSP